MAGVMPNNEQGDYQHPAEWNKHKRGERSGHQDSQHRGAIRSDDSQEKQQRRSEAAASTKHQSVLPQLDLGLARRGVHAGHYDQHPAREL
jgi:hypothetical protein